MLVPEISFGTRQGSFSSSFESGSRRVSHEGERKGSEGKEEEIVQQEKQKERPELKVVISHLISIFSSSIFPGGHL